MCRNAQLEDLEAPIKKPNGKSINADDEVVYTCMWSPPRSLSTTVERALIEAKSVHVLHEPFGTPFYWSGQAASSRQEGDARCDETFADVARRCFQDVPPPGKRFVFTKNLSYYVSPHCIPDMKAFFGGTYSKVRHSFMIRHPAKAVSSLYYKSCIDNEKTGYTHFDATEAGFTAMWKLMQHLEAQDDLPPVVIVDADDLLEDPEGIMTAYCDALGLPFNPSMLSWQPGPEHCPELASPFQGWTDDVQNSSGIQKRAKRSLPPVVTSLPRDVQECIEEAMPIYTAMYARRVRPFGEDSSIGASSDDGGAVWKDGGKKQPNGTNMKRSDSSTHGRWGKDDEARGEPCLNSRCCRRAFDEPAKVTGFLLLIVSVFIWVGQAELLQSIHSDGWAKPYFQAASLKSVWSLTLPVWMVLSKINQAFQDEITFRRPLQPSFKVLTLCLMLTVLVQASSATWIASLDLTAVSVNSAIYNINPLLVYVFSIPILSEPPSVTKSSAVLLAMVGTSVVTLGTASSPMKAGAAADGAEATTKEGAIFGNVLVLASACLFALKEVLFKRHFASVSISLTPFTDALLVVGLIGIISLFTLPILTLVLHYSGFEPFELPTPELLRGYGLVAVMMASYQACLLAAIALTSPTFVAMGTMLAVPASILFDFTLKAYVPPPVAMLGILGIVLAFTLLVFADRLEEYLNAGRRAALRSCEPNGQLVAPDKAKVLV